MQLLFGFDKDAYSPKLCLILERIISDALEDHKGSLRVGGRIFINFRVVDDIVVNAEEEEEPNDIITSVDTICTSSKMQIGLDKTEIMTNNPNGFLKKD